MVIIAFVNVLTSYETAFIYKSHGFYAFESLYWMFIRKYGEDIV